MLIPREYAYKVCSISELPIFTNLTYSELEILRKHSREIQNSCEQRMEKWKNIISGLKTQIISADGTWILDDESISEIELKKNYEKFLREYGNSKYEYSLDKDCIDPFDVSDETIKLLIPKFLKSKCIKFERSDFYVDAEKLDYDNLKTIDSNCEKELGSKLRMNLKKLEHLAQKYPNEKFIDLISRHFEGKAKNLFKMFNRENKDLALLSNNNNLIPKMNELNIEERDSENQPRKRKLFVEPTQKGPSDLTILPLTYSQHFECNKKRLKRSKFRDECNSSIKSKIFNKFAELEKFIEENSNSIEALLIYGDEVIKNKSGNDIHIQRSINFYDRALELEPENDEIYYFKGRFLRNFSLDKEEALKCFKTAYSLCSDNIDALEAIAEIYNEMGDEELLRDSSKAKPHYLKSLQYYLREETSNFENSIKINNLREVLLDIESNEKKEIKPSIEEIKNIGVKIVSDEKMKSFVDRLQKLPDDHAGKIKGLRFLCKNFENDKIDAECLKLTVYRSQYEIYR